MSALTEVTIEHDYHVTLMRQYHKHLLFIKSLCKSFIDLFVFFSRLVNTLHDEYQEEEQVYV